MHENLASSRVCRLLRGDEGLVPALDGEVLSQLIRGTAAGVEQQLRKCDIKPGDFTRALEALDRIQHALTPAQKREVIDAAVQMVCNELGITNGRDLQFDAMLVKPGEIAPINSATPNSRAPDRLESELKKRFLINALLQGGAHAVQYRFLFENEALNRCNPGMVSACRQLMVTADAMVLTVDDSRLDFSRIPPAGVCRLDFKTRPTTVLARALHLPVLIHEIAKGALEALALHGLPANEADRKTILAHTDRPQYEGWGIAFGGDLWKKVIDVCPRELDARGRSEWLQGLFKLPAPDFVERINGIVQG